MLLVYLVTMAIYNDQGLEPSDNRARERKQYSASDHTIGKRQLRTDTIRQ